MIGWHFIKWMFANIFGKLNETHNEAKYLLNRRPGETTFIWILVTLVLSVVQLLIVGFVGWLTNTIPSFWWISGFTLTMIAHYVYTAFAVMFGRFKKERAELFETIKNSN